MTDATEIPTLEEVQAAQEEIAAAREKTNRFELSRLDVLLEYMDGAAYKNVLAKLEEIAVASLPGGTTHTAATNTRLGLERATVDVNARRVTLFAQLNPPQPIPPIPLQPIPPV